MIRIRRGGYIFFCGFIWLLIGFFLLVLGSKYILYSALLDGFDPSMNNFIKNLAVVTKGNEQAGVFLICIGLLIGYIIGKKSFSKSVAKIIDRVDNHCLDKYSLFKIYSVRYWIILITFLFICLYLQFYEISHDLSGLINLIMGASLVNGSMHYFRSMFS